MECLLYEEKATFKDPSEQHHLTADFYFRLKMSIHISANAKFPSAVGCECLVLISQFSSLIFFPFRLRRVLLLLCLKESQDFLSPPPPPPPFSFLYIFLLARFIGRKIGLVVAGAHSLHVSFF